jgi:hypothetical protein
VRGLLLRAKHLSVVAFVTGKMKHEAPGGSTPGARLRCTQTDHACGVHGPRPQHRPRGLRFSQHAVPIASSSPG